MKNATSMWADMLGLGPLLAQINDPSFQAELRGFVGSQFETLERVRRCETLLVAIAEQLGIDDGGNRRIAALPEELGTNAAGGFAVASLPADDGAGGAAARNEPAQRRLNATGRR